MGVLEDAHDSDEDGPLRPKEIKPWQVKKKKGEFEKEAIKREVDKYAGKKETTKKKKEEEVEDEAAVAGKEEVKKKKKADDKKEDKEEHAKPVEDRAEDLMIKPDLDAAKDKYTNRKKLPKKDLPREELEEEKENRPVAQ